MQQGDHPRACGEQVGIISKIPTQIGSPPRVRGTADQLHKDHMLDGITPARAGNRWA